MPAGDVVPRRAEDRAAQNARRIVFSVGSGLIRLFFGRKCCGSDGNGYF